MNKAYPPKSLVPVRSLPLYAQVAIERVSNDNTLRSVDNLNYLLMGYAKTYGLAVDDDVRRAALAICEDRFPEDFSESAPARFRAAAQDDPGPSF